MAKSESNLITLAEVRDNNFVVDNDALFEFMERPEMKSGKCPLVIISIAGAFRSGKSFIMNFFLRYLRNKGWLNPRWFGDDQTSLTGDFPWRRGADACTKGINVWPEIFSVPTKDGRQAAVILVDTQGLFDEDTSPDINAKLMSLSTLFCSHQVLNLMRQIEERDLEHLQLCNAFAQAAGSIGKRSEAKPFQKLTFLVRDWEHEEGFGDSTDGYLQRYFSKKSKSPEVQKVKDSIRDAFDSVGSTMLPHPGTKVVRSKEGHLSTNRDLDEDFKEYVIKFVNGVLHPENLVIKRGSDGNEETIEGLGGLLGTVSKAFKAGKLPTAKTLLQSVVRGSNTNALNTAVAKYKKQMIKVCQELLNSEKLEANHQKSLMQAVEHFHNRAKMGGEEDKAEFLAQLEIEIANGFDYFERKNEGKKAEKKLEFQKIISEYTKVYVGKIKKIGQEVASDNFEFLHQKYKQELISRFDSVTDNFTKVMPEIKDLRKELENLMTSRYEDVKKSWELNKQKMQERNRGKCLALKYEIKRDFENAIEKFESQFTSNLERILEDLKKDAFVAYDKGAASNPEKQAVQTNRNALEEELRKAARRAVYLNEEQKELIVSKARALVHITASGYRLKMQEVKLDVDNETFERNHIRYVQEAMKEFDDKTKCSEDILPKIRQLREQVSKKISDVHTGIVRDRERDNNLKQTKSIENSTETMRDILNDFRKKAQKYEDENYVESVVMDFRAECLSRYDRQMESNSEKAAVTKNRKELETEMADMIKRLKSSSMRAEAAKEAQWRQFMWDCLSQYNSSTKKAALTQLATEHSRNKNMALRNFDIKVQGFENLSAVKKLRTNLNAEIENTFRDIETNKENEAKIKETGIMEKAEDCAKKVEEKFQEKADQYQNTYKSNLKAILDSFKANCVKEYDEEMASNNKKNTEALKTKLDRIISLAVTNNTSQHGLLREEYRNLGQDYANELEETLEEPMRKAHLAENVLDQYKEEYVRNKMQTSDDYKDLPPWGKKIVDDAIADMVLRLKKTNEANKNHRSVEISNFEKFIGIVKGIIGFPLKLAKTAWKIVSAPFRS